jgi:hypothetical protein
MLNINLVPEVKKEQNRLKKINWTVTTIAVVVGSILAVVIVLLGSLAGYRAVRIGSVDADIKKIEGELVAYKDLEESVATLEVGLAEINKIVAGGRDWNDYLGEIEKATPADIQFTSFQVTGNTVSANLNGKDVQSIDRFIKSFSGYKGKDGQNMFTNVTVDGYTSDTGVTFSAKFDVAGEIK